MILKCPREAKLRPVPGEMFMFLLEARLLQGPWMVWPTLPVKARGYFKGRKNPSEGRISVLGTKLRTNSQLWEMYHFYAGGDPSPILPCLGIWLQILLTQSR